MPSTLHARGGFVDRATVDAVELPPSTESHHPVHYSTLIDLMIESLKVRGWEIKSQKHALANNGMRYFGVFDILKRGKNLGPGVEMIAGLRSSLDRRISNEFLAGWRVPVSDTIQFTAELLARGRHTRHIMDRLPSVILNAVRDLEPYLDRQREAVEKMRIRIIDLPFAHHQMILMAQNKIISWGDVKRVSNTFITDDRWGKKLTLWRLSNAAALNLKGHLETNGASFAERTSKLTAQLMKVA